MPAYDGAIFSIGQVDRVSTLSTASSTNRQQFKLRGKPICISADRASKRRGPNSVECAGDRLRVLIGDRSTPPARTIENWLRRQARTDIELAIAKYAPRVRRWPNKVYIMGQRTKWGSCSARGNLSFNWRLVMAPPFVLDYLVAHELVHLLVPRHSQEFWLFVRGICPRFDVARNWLKDHGHELIAWRARRALH